jgi:Na+-transporting NADH:ubiquinone oxidoreductase subunit F
MFISILNTILILTGITGFLALILVLSNMVFANYGECEIDINGKKKLQIKGGNSLLQTLNDNNIFLASACGGRGTCGFCKCRVIEGGGPLLPTERPFISPEEIENNVRLACQVKVRNDIKIKIPEDIFNIQRYSATAIKIIDLTYDIKELTLQLVEPNSINFKAGQYVQFEAPPYEKTRHSVTRAYSISSSPQNTNLIQLIVRRVKDGICTTYIHDYLKEGDTVHFTGPFGNFYIRETEADMIFVAGGSGQAPIKSMIEYLYSEKSKRRMVYFFGARTLKDLYLFKEFKEFEKKMHNFTYIPVISQPEPNAQWTGKTGHIPPYLKDYINDPDNTEGYLCGSPGMIAAVEKTLIDANVRKDKIYYDSF